MAAAGRPTWRSVTALRPHGLFVAIRHLCSSRQREPSKSSTFSPEPSSKYDWIGPPNPLSNLRPIVYHIPEKESELEKQLRKLRQETEDWNHDFWTNQNISFSKEKEAFIISQLKAKGLALRDEDGRRRALNTEEMAVFYRNFLDKNRIRHANYNKEWYRRNFTITLLMARVALQSMRRTLAETLSRKRSSSATTGQ